jgi:hypothetical protein
MYNIMLFIHVVSATLLGVYLVIPFIWSKTNDLLADAQYSYLQILTLFNRIGQFSLIALFITGGYMVSQVDVTVTWIITVIALLVLIGALTGMIGSKMKKMMALNKQGKLIIKEVSSLKLFFWINGIFVVTSIYLMLNQNII